MCEPRHVRILVVWLRIIGWNVNLRIVSALFAHLRQWNTYGVKRVHYSTHSTENLPWNYCKFCGSSASDIMSNDVSIWNSEFPWRVSGPYLIHLPMKLFHLISYDCILFILYDSTCFCRHPLRFPVVVTFFTYLHFLFMLFGDFFSIRFIALIVIDVYFIHWIRLVLVVICGDGMFHCSILVAKVEPSTMRVQFLSMYVSGCLAVEVVRVMWSVAISRLQVGSVCPAQLAG
jgi:hypothetical protein